MFRTQLISSHRTSLNIPPWSHTLRTNEIADDDIMIKTELDKFQFAQIIFSTINWNDEGRSIDNVDLEIRHSGFSLGQALHALHSTALIPPRPLSSVKLPFAAFSLHHIYFLVLRVFYCNCEARQERKEI